MGAGLGNVWRVPPHTGVSLGERIRWEVNNHKWKGREPGFFKAANVYTYDGNLYLRSQIENNDDIPEDLKSKGYKDFSTAFVRTHKKRKYGYFEIVCLLADSNISSAFWFAGRSGDHRTELDVFEYSTSDKPVRNSHYRNIFSTNVHVHAHPDESVPDKYKDQQSYDIGFDLSSKRVKVGFNWQHDYIEWYLNDVLIRRIENKYFHQELHLQLDSETFPNWFGLPDLENNKLPAHFRIMYVRTWYQVPDN